MWPSARSHEPAAPNQATYTKDIAPLLWKNCACCHRPGEIGPFSLLNYEDARKRADFIAEITKEHRMPPWKAEPDFGKFQDERRLSPTEIATIASWAAAGAPEGDPKDLPKPPEFFDGWHLGEPDMVLKMASAFSIPASGPDAYRCFVINVPIEKDMMISAAEFRPGNRKVVHHAIMYLDANGQGRSRDGEDGKPGFPSFGGPGIMPSGGVGGWTPGSVPRFLPDGIVKYVKKGSDLVLQLHYHPTGKPETDQSTVGLYFSKQPVRKIVTGIAVAQLGLKIPAGDAHCEINAATDPLPADVQVLGITPHMHNLGRQFKAVAVDPTGKRSVPLIWIKDWDFNWQGSYQFARPIRLPKGSRILVRAIYDNSAANTKNPNSPPKDVAWGEQSIDEMCLCSVQVFTDTPGDLRKVAVMFGHELGAGLDGGVPGMAALVKKVVGGKRGLARQSARAQARPRRIKRPPPSKRRRALSRRRLPANRRLPRPQSPRKNRRRRRREPEIPFPDAGIQIPENVRQLFGNFDLDGNGTLSRDEADKMPAAAREMVMQSWNRSQKKGK